MQLDNSFVARACLRLRQLGYKLKFCTNETQITRRALVEKLRKHGFTLSEEEVHSPAHACRAYLATNGLRPHLLGECSYRRK